MRIARLAQYAGAAALVLCMSTATMAPATPPEVTALIFNALNALPVPYPRANRRSIAACSLVCSAWRPIAQAVLFADVSLAVEKGLDNFRAMLEAAPPHIPAAVRALSVWTRKFPGEPADPLADMRTEEGRAHAARFLVSPVVLMCIVEAMTDLRRLSISPVVLLGWPKDVPLPSRRIVLRHLGLHGIMYRPFALVPDARAFDLLSFFDADVLYSARNTAMYPEGRTVQFPDSEVLALKTPDPPRVRRITVNGGDCFISCNLGQGGLDPEVIRTLTLRPTDLASLAADDAILRRYGRNPSDISLNVADVLESQWKTGQGVDAGTWDALSLRPCENLQSLRFVWSHRETWDSPPYSEQDEMFDTALRAFLASMPPSTLRAFEIAVPSLVTLDEFNQTARYVARRVEQAVERFPGRRTVIVGTGQRLAPDLCDEVMYGMLPARIAKRGMVRCEYKWPY
ncbi:hypothetical protein C8Q77DRAFT_418905 [Trametes polyzona]|nr:hypothetical protein C8Q77DRAFT_418905 [Trametes polyzona]